jgi:uncharacterized membrane protein
MLRALGLFVVAVIFAVFAINAIFMLVSPRAWFRLPRWLLFNGSMTERKYGSGLGAVETRLGGAAMLAAILWVLYEALLKRP